MLGERAIKNRLQKHFDTNYGEYNDTVEWFGDELDNEWKFALPNTDTTVILKCDKSTGKVTERTISTKKEKERLLNRALGRSTKLLYN